MTENNEVALRIELVRAATQVVISGMQSQKDGKMEEEVFVSAVDFLKKEFKGVTEFKYHPDTVEQRATRESAVSRSIG